MRPAIRDRRSSGHRRSGARRGSGGLESTVSPRRASRSSSRYSTIAGKKVLIAHCPERALPGKTLDEIVHNDRIIGGLTEEASVKARSLYACFARGELLITDATTAETAKLIENTFRDVNIALANELESIGRELGIDVQQAIRLANRHPRVDGLQPGPGVGGHCLPIDPWFLVEDSVLSRLIPTARAINRQRPRAVAEVANRILRRLGEYADRRWALPTRRMSTICRDSPSLALV